MPLPPSRSVAFVEQLRCSSTIGEEFHIMSDWTMKYFEDYFQQAATVGGQQSLESFYQELKDAGVFSEAMRILCRKIDLYDEGAVTVSVYGFLILRRLFPVCDASFYPIFKEDTDTCALLSSHAEEIFRHFFDLHDQFMADIQCRELISLHFAFKLLHGIFMWSSQDFKPELRKAFPREGLLRFAYSIYLDPRCNCDAIDPDDEEEYLRGEWRPLLQCELIFLSLLDNDIDHYDFKNEAANWALSRWSVNCIINRCLQLFDFWSYREQPLVRGAGLFVLHVQTADAFDINLFYYAISVPMVKRSWEMTEILYSRKPECASNVNKFARDMIICFAKSQRLLQRLVSQNKIQVPREADLAHYQDVILLMGKALITEGCSNEGLENDVLAIARYIAFGLEHCQGLLKQNAALYKAVMHVLQTIKSANLPHDRASQAHSIWVRRLVQVIWRLSDGGRSVAASGSCSWSECPLYCAGVNTALWTGRRSKICGQCRKVTYCRVECQINHWNRGGHKLECWSDSADET